MSDARGFRSSIAAIAPLCRDSDPAIGRSACARIWHEAGLLVANPEHFSWSGQTRIEQLGDELYGKRGRQADGKS